MLLLWGRKPQTTAAFHGDDIGPVAGQHAYPIVGRLGEWFEEVPVRQNRRQPLFSEDDDRDL